MGVNVDPTLTAVKANPAEPVPGVSAWRHPQVFPK